MPQRKQNPDDRAPSGNGSALLKLTKMIERKTKDSEVGDLIHYSFHDQGAVWIVAHNIAALSEIAVRVEVEEDVFEDRSLTEILLAGQQEPLYVAERAEEIARRIG
jgi:hypothetical protein